MGDEPVARGEVVLVGERHRPQLEALAKEALSTLRALRAEASVRPEASPSADFVLLLVGEQADAPSEAALPDLRDRAGSAAAVAADAAAGRVAVALARKHLRAHGAALGARELVFSPDQFGYLGLESDTLRERLEILLRSLVLDAERLRLKREGWEEPESKLSDRT